MATPPPTAAAQIGSGMPISGRTGSCRTCPALHLQLTEPAQGQRRRHTRRGIDVRHRASPEDVISHLRERRITLTYDPASGALNAGTAETAQTITLTAS
jgi:hypothetical protein